MKEYDLRETLNRLKWKEGAGLSDVVIHFVSRGEPNDEGIVAGSEIISIGTSGIETATRMIPYHRISRIVRGGTTVFERH